VKDAGLEPDTCKSWQVCGVKTMVVSAFAVQTPVTVLPISNNTAVLASEPDRSIIDLEEVDTSNPFGSTVSFNQFHVNTAPLALFLCRRLCVVPRFATGGGEAIDS